MGRSEHFNDGAKRQVLYHGTTATGAKEIDLHGLRANDIGAVYATHTEERAEMWAKKRGKDNQDQPAVVEFHAHGEVGEGAREGEAIHWGHVPAKHIRNIWHVDPDDD